MGIPTNTQTRQSSFITIATTLIACVAAPLLVYHGYKQRQDRLKRRQDDERDGLTLSKHSDVNLKPPFPQQVRDLFSKCRLAYLSTVDAAAGSSHLSLMRFTYLTDKEDGEVVIMSTNMKTKKFEMLQKQKGVALLVHDFQQSSSSSSANKGMYSITLNGECRIVMEPVKREHYRTAHLNHNPDYPQFIVGPDIAILCIDITSARICNINDQVIKWDVADGKEMPLK